MSIRWNADSLLGARLGSCVLERTLGVGGMGAVYLAQQERPHRRVAVKVLHPQLTSDPRAWSVFLARFRREADATAALDHTNIVPIYEFGEQDGVAYLVMPYLADGSLADLLAREGPLPLPRARTYLAQAAAALDYAHAHGIIHRDVKPSNLLLHPDGRLLLADFGIAHPLDRDGRALAADVAARLDARAPADPTLTTAGVVMGTPQYMAPEQIRGEPVNSATDTYALGILTYAMLTGQPPFTGGTSDEILRRQVTEAPQPVRALRLDVSPQVEETIFWALAKHPEDRPETAGTFARALGDASRRKTVGALFGQAAALGARSAEAFRGASRQPTPYPPHPSPRLSLGTEPLRPGMRLGDTYAPEATVPIQSPRSPIQGYAASATDDEPTIFDASTSGSARGYLPGGTHGGTPVWPAYAGPDAPLPQAGQQLGKRSRLGAVAIVAAGLLVVALLATALISGLAPSSLPGRGVGAAVRPTATATVTPLPTATPSPTPNPNWLSVSQSSVTLACKGANKSARIVLTNGGSQDTYWYASAPFFGGVSVSPGMGPLPSGNSVTITLTNNSYFTGQSGTITFTSTDASAGTPPTVSYTTQVCR